MSAHTHDAGTRADAAALALRMYGSGAAEGPQDTPLVTLQDLVAWDLRWPDDRVHSATQFRQCHAGLAHLCRRARVQLALHEAPQLGAAVPLNEDTMRAGQCLLASPQRGQLYVMGADDLRVYFGRPMQGSTPVAREIVWHGGNGSLPGVLHRIASQLAPA